MGIPGRCRVETRLLHRGMSAPVFFLLGESAALGAALVWSASLATFRYYGDGFPAQEANLFKNVIAAVSLGVLIAILGISFPADRSVWGWLVLSGLIGIAVGDTAFFAALSRLNAQLTAVTQCLSPVTASLLAWAWLGETLGRNELFGMGLTLSAVTGAVWLGGHTRALTRRHLFAGLAFAVLSAVANGTGIVIARSAFQTVDAVAGTEIRVLAALLVLVPQCLFSRSPGFSFGSLFHPMRKGIALSLSAFAGSFLGLLLMSVGIKYAKAGVAAALSLTYPIWILPLARLFLGERTTPVGVLCILLAVLGVGLMFWH